MAGSGTQEAAEGRGRKTAWWSLLCHLTAKVAKTCASETTEWIQTNIAIREESAIDHIVAQDKKRLTSWSG